MRPLLWLKAKRRGREELGSMIEEINETQVEAEEVLSDRAYYYDRESGKLAL